MHTAQEILNASLANARIMVQENMRASDAWLIRGILCIFDRQTADEQNSEDTKHHNGVGFGGADAQILSSFAKQIQKHQRDLNPKFRSPLSPRQLEIARKKMSKYAMQLVRIARDKADAKRRAEETEAKLVEMEADAGYRG